MKKILIILIVFVSLIFANGDRYYDYAKVTYSEPIYEYVYEREPQRECKEVRQRVEHYDNRTQDNSLGLDSLIGVASGVAIGNQIGGGNGRDVARVLGGIIGGKVAHEIRNYNSSSSYNDYETVTKCYNTTKKVKRKMITGYKNYFVYKGVEHFKVTTRPESKIKITHTIDF